MPPVIPYRLVQAGEFTCACGHRRGFLTALAAIAATAALDPERTLWVPGKKLISIPKPKTIEVATTPPWFRVGDIVCFGRDPMRLVVTAIDSDCKNYPYARVEMRPAVESDFRPALVKARALVGGVPRVPRILPPRGPAYL